MDKAFRAILLPFITLAAMGFVLSVAAHVQALRRLPMPGGKAGWALHTGIFVVWLPTVVVAYRFTRGVTRKDFWKIALIGCPKWMRQALYVIFGYAILNFIYFMATTVNRPPSRGDAPPEVVRGFSGHWMVFYGAAFATLYSAVCRWLFRNPTQMPERTERADDGKVLRRMRSAACVAPIG